MLVTFTCETHEPITMFGDVAKRLIQLMGHSGQIPSAILAKEVPDALRRLQSALETEKKANNASASEKSKSEYEEEPEIRLTQRAFPLIALLENAIAHQCNVMWHEGSAQRL